MERLALQDIDELLLIPLLPHYAMSSYETAVERVKVAVMKFAPTMRLHVQAPYYGLPDYIDALVASAMPYLKNDFDHLLFSFSRLTGAAPAQIRQDLQPLLESAELLRNSQSGAHHVLPRTMLQNNESIRGQSWSAAGKVFHRFSIAPWARSVAAAICG